MSNEELTAAIELCFKLLRACSTCEPINASLLKHFTALLEEQLLRAKEKP